MKRLFILSAFASLMAATLSPLWAGTKHDTAKNSIGNIRREACQGKPEGAIVKIAGKNEKCPAPPESEPITKTKSFPLPPRPATHIPESKPADRTP